MKNIFARPAFITLSILFLSLTTLSPAEARAPREVNCDEGETIQEQLDKAQIGDVIEVSGACSENILIVNSAITLRGVGGATLDGPDTTTPTIRVRGLNTRIEDFASISGGSNVVHVQRGASADILNNVVENGASSGVLVNQSAYARVTGNTIKNNGTQGVNVRQSASADILSNVIGGDALSGNGLRGIQVSDAAEADIDDNTITNNGSDGIRIRRTSHIRLSEEGGLGVPNLIEANGGRGVRCQTNSSIRSPFAQDFGAGNGSGNFLNQGCVVDGTVE
jgi:parallel beta-helix repeat protein